MTPFSGITDEDAVQVRRYQMKGISLEEILTCTFQLEPSLYRLLQTEDQKKLENLADDVLTRAIISSGRAVRIQPLCAMLSHTTLSEATWSAMQKVIVTGLHEEPIIVDKRSRGR